MHVCYVCVSVCVPVDVRVWRHMLAHVHVCGRQRTTSGSFLRHGQHSLVVLAWRSPRRMGRLSLGISLLHSASTGAVRLYVCAWLFHVSSADRTEGLTLAGQAFCQRSHLPGPVPLPCCQLPFSDAAAGAVCWPVFCTHRQCSNDGAIELRGIVR